LQVRTCSPQPPPQAWVSTAPTAQTPDPWQELQPPHWHAPLQYRVWVPQLPHAWDSDAPAVHEPCPPQEPHGPQPQPALQVRVRVPQKPQVSLPMAPG
jgi:hypothetical protein